MAGGLIQVVSYGSQDLYLTGTPEITFFKIVYRRHTNFSVESIRVNFDDPVGFGKTSSLTIPKVGDIALKTYIEIITPQIDFKRFNTSDALLNALLIAQQNFQIVQDFMSINRNAYVSALDIFDAENTTGVDAIRTAIDDVFNRSGNLEKIDNFRNLLSMTNGTPFTYDEVSMQSIVSRAADDRETLFRQMTIGIDKSIKTQDFFFNRLKTVRENLADDQNENVKFAWVDRLGHAIIEEIEVHIGGQKIDRHFGDWLNIWYELSGNKDMDQIYKKMIGDVEELITFDRSIKPRYRLKIPLQFWFCRFSGLGIPLVALEHHDVRFTVKFRKLEDVSYMENGRTIKFSDTESGLFLDEVVNELGVDIEGSMLIDYAYLDIHERRKFAQSAHEYLIDQLQVEEVTNISQRQLQCVLNSFVHPSRELIWVAQKVRYTENINGYTKLRWDNYSLTDENRGQLIRFSSIGFHSYVRVPRLDSNYFNYVQPYQHHRATPSDGINVYSFSIFPEEHQPSGSANMSRLSRVVLNLEFDDSLFPENGEPELLNLRIYTRNLNILRIINGSGGLAYVYG